MSADAALARLARRLEPVATLDLDDIGERDCPECLGEGTYEALDHERTQPWHWEPTLSEFPCERCGATGRAPRVVFTIRPAEPLVDAPIPLGGDDHELDLPF